MSDVKLPEEIETASEGLTEDSISTEAIDFEDSSFLEENDHKGDSESKELDEYEKEIVEKSAVKKEEDEEEYLSPEQKMDKIIKEIANQPFEVALGNLEISKEEVIRAAHGIFSSKGYFESTYNLPFGGTVTMRSKTVNDYIDYTEYVRRLLLDPISQKEFDTITQLRNMAYAVVEMDGDDFSEMGIEDKFNMLRNTSEVKVTALINETVTFWRTAHMLLHPGLIDFLASTPEE